MTTDMPKAAGMVFVSAMLLGALFYNLGTLPYLETSEARYAEIAREMAVSGDWVTPRLLGIKHFDKPPLTYWVTAAAFRIMGVNDFSGRLPLALAALIMLWYTRRLGRLLFPEEPFTADIGVLVLGSSILFLVLARSLTTDFYLALFTLAATYHLLRWFFQGRQSREALLSALFLGLGLLTKGHVIFVFYLLPWVPVAYLNRVRRPAKPIDLLLFICVPLIIFLPWALAVARENPQLIGFFFGEQTLGRIATNMHHRSEPIYFHLVVLCLGMLFWCTYFLALLPGSVRNPRSKAETLLLFFTLIPFLFFSLNRSKLAPYLLPSVPFYAVLISHWITESVPRPELSWADRINLVLAGILVAAELALPWLPLESVPPIPAVWMAFAVTSLVLWLGMLWGWKKRPVCLRMGFAGLNMILFLAAVSAAPAVQENINGFRTVAAAIQADRHDSRPYRIIAYRERLSSITFYTGIRIIQIPHDRNLRFEDKASRRALEAYVAEDIRRIPQLLAQPVPTYLIIKRHAWDDLRAQFPMLKALVHPVYATRRYLVMVSRP